jgi:hypothetical protein
MKGEMGGTEHEWENWDVHTNFWSENVKRKDHLEDLGVNESIALNGC